MFYANSYFMLSIFSTSHQPDYCIELCISTIINFLLLAQCYFFLGGSDDVGVFPRNFSIASSYFLFAAKISMTSYNGFGSASSSMLSIWLKCRNNENLLTFEKKLKIQIHCRLTFWWSSTTTWSVSHCCRLYRACMNWVHWFCRSFRWTPCRFSPTIWSHNYSQDRTTNS